MRRKKIDGHATCEFPAKRKKIKFLLLSTFEFFFARIRSAFSFSENGT